MKLMLMSFNRKKKMLRLWRLGHNQQSVTIWFIQRVCPECCLSLWQRGSPAPVNSVSQQTLENAKCSQKTVTDFQQHLKGTCVPNSRQREENALFSQKNQSDNKELASQGNSIKTKEERISRFWKPSQSIKKTLSKLFFKANIILIPNMMKILKVLSTDLTYEQ